MKTYNKINEKIKQRRTELGLSDTEVANRLGLTVSTYFDIEHKKNEIYLYPELLHVKRLCKMLGFDLLELMGLECEFCKGANPEKFSFPTSDLIARRRRERGISVEELGELVGFDESEIEELEANPERIETWPIDFIKDLADVLDLPLQTLLKAKCRKCGM